MSTDTEYGWVVMELMGHARVAGRLTRDEVGLRLDMPATPGQPASTHWYGQGAIYAIHAVDEATARQCAAAWRPEPVSRWELPAAPDIHPWQSAASGDLDEDPARYDDADDDEGS